MRKLIFYLNGKFVSSENAKISILDLGVLRGFGVFDFLRTYNGKPFKTEEHLKRLYNSASEIGLRMIWEIRKIKKLVLETLRKNNLPEANIKIVVTGGVSADQITPSERPTLAILIYPIKPYPKEYYENGVKVITFKIQRNFSQAKSINYIPAMVALKKAREKGAVEAIYLNSDNELLEGTTSNFFVFKDNILQTAKEGILKGITRQVVLDLAKKEFKVERRSINYQESKNIKEAFITASNKEVMPVVKIDDLVVGDGRVGECTKKIMEMFREYTQNL